MTHYTVKQVARLSGVSVRTLHHYHDLGLLTPALIGENRYRYYGERELLRLQQILFYREFGISLQEIAAFLDRPGFDHVAALEQHRARLQAETERTRQLIRTIDRTIAQLKGAGAMKHADLYKGFSAEKQAEYEDWLTDSYGDGMDEKIEATRAHLKNWSDRDHAEAMAELAAYWRISSRFPFRRRARYPPQIAPATMPAITSMTFSPFLFSCCTGVCRPDLQPVRRPK